MGVCQFRDLVVYKSPENLASEGVVRVEEVDLVGYLNRTENCLHLTSNVSMENVLVATGSNIPHGSYSALSSMCNDSPKVRSPMISKVVQLYILPISIASGLLESCFKIRIN